MTIDSLGSLRLTGLVSDESKLSYKLQSARSDHDCDRFAEVEVVAALTALITRYTIHLTDEMDTEFKSLNLTMPQQMNRLLKSKALITTT